MLQIFDLKLAEFEVLLAQMQIGSSSPVEEEEEDHDHDHAHAHERRRRSADISTV